MKPHERWDGTLCTDCDPRLTDLDRRVPPLHRHAALDEAYELSDGGGDLRGGRRHQLHLPVLDERRPPRRRVHCEVKYKSMSELMGSLRLGNVWVIVQLVFGPCWPVNQLNKNPILLYLRLPISSGQYR